MSWDFSSFPLDVFENPKCTFFLDRKGLLSDKYLPNGAAKTLSPTLNRLDYSELIRFYSYFDILKKGLEYLIRDTISLIHENQKISISIIRKSTAVIYFSIVSVSNAAYQAKSSFLSRVKRIIFLLIESILPSTVDVIYDDDFEERIMNELCSIYTLSLFLNIAIRLNDNQRGERDLLLNLSEELIRKRRANIGFSCIEFPLLFEDCMDKVPNSHPSLEYYLFQNYKELNTLEYKKYTNTYLESFVKDYCKNRTKYRLK